MSLEDDDDFWNTSGVKAFNFDDEDQTSSNAPSVIGVKTLGSILAARPSSNQPFLRPSMILCGGDRIEQLIEHLDNTRMDQTPIFRQDPKAYVRDIVEKRLPIDFSPYKSKSDKLILLDSAICLADGNTITAATIFLSKTLKTSIFVEEMKKRPMAIDHYLNHSEKPLGAELFGA